MERHAGSLRPHHDRGPLLRFRWRRAAFQPAHAGVFSAGGSGHRTVYIAGVRGRPCQPVILRGESHSRGCGPHSGAAAAPAISWLRPADHGGNARAPHQQSRTHCGADRTVGRLRSAAGTEQLRHPRNYRGTLSGGRVLSGWRRIAHRRQYRAGDRTRGRPDRGGRGGGADPAGRAEAGDGGAHGRWPGTPRAPDSERCRRLEHLRPAAAG